MRPTSSKRTCCWDQDVSRCVQGRRRARLFILRTEQWADSARAVLFKWRRMMSRPPPQIISRDSWSIANERPGRQTGSDASFPSRHTNAAAVVVHSFVLLTSSSTLGPSSSSSPFLSCRSTTPSFFCFVINTSAAFRLLVDEDDAYARTARLRLHTADRETRG